MTENAINDRDLWLSGNEAIALGAYEAGVKVASGYPGTPSTEILENLCEYEGMHAEWAPNEKVGLEVAIGASFAGVRALATMKHVGVNVAADPLFTAAYTGVRGGLVVITADDPEMHSSQNEQDNRNYAFAAKLPMLEPSDPSEAKAFMKLAYALSEAHDTPVLVRTTTRIAHVKGIVPRGEKVAATIQPGLERLPAKLVMLPANARKRRGDLTLRMEKLKALAETLAENRVERGDPTLGIITSGVAYLYVKEAFPTASVLKLGMVHPLPETMIRDFAASVEKLYVVEELDPFLETHIKAMGIACTGKAIVPAAGELNPHILRRAFGLPASVPFQPVDLPPRPPNLCAGCPHRGLFHTLSKLKVFVSGDIGCYTLGFLPPLSAMDTCVCMGASIGVAHGLDKALGPEALGKVVAVIGDSTFLHSGMTGLANVAYNKGVSTTIILDNRITAMTGHQPNPTSGSTLQGQPAPEIDLVALCRALGVPNVVVVDPLNLKETHDAIKAEIERPEPSVLITRRPCVLLPSEKKRKKTPFAVNRDRCTGCGACARLGCPAINWVAVTEEEAKALGFRKGQKGFSLINEACTGCGLCAQVCKFEAIGLAGQGGAK